jgi:hypothetical protein
MPETRILSPLPKDSVDYETVKENYSRIHARLSEMGRKFTEVIPFPQFCKELHLTEEQ